MQAERRQVEHETDFSEAVPPGTPAWITPELIRRTLKTWQPFYAERLTPEDAVTMVLNVGRLFGLLSRE